MEVGALLRARTHGSLLGRHDLWPAAAASLLIAVAGAVLARPVLAAPTPSPSGTARVDALIERSQGLLREDPEGAGAAAAAAVEEAARLGDREVRARAAFALGDALRGADRYRDARESYREAARLAAAVGDGELAARSQRRTGDCSHFLGDYEDALSAYFAALRTYDGLRASDVDGRFELPIGHLHAAIGNVLRRTEQRQEALRYYTMALEIYRRREFTSGIAGCLLNIGTIQQELGRLDEALASYLEARNMTEKLGDRYLLSILHNDIGAVELAQGRYAEAIGEFQTAKAICEADGRSQGLVVSLVKLGEATAQQGQHRASIAFYEEALPLAEKIEDRAMVAEIHRALAGERESLGDLAGALAELRLHGDLRGRLLDEASTRQINELRETYEAEAREREIETMRAEQALQRRVRTALAGAVALALLLAGVLASRYRLKHRAAAESAEMCRRLDRLASTDEVSGLPNRRAAAARLGEEQARADRGGRVFTLALADIDDFKGVNDRHGHRRGDAALRELGELVRSTIRTEDFVARWGGDELIFILPDTGLEGGAVAAEKLRAAIAAAELDCDGQSITVTVTIGVAAYQPGGSVIVAERGADEALYRGKAEGKNRVVTAVPPEAEPPANATDGVTEHEGSPDDCSTEQ